MKRTAMTSCSTFGIGSDRGAGFWRGVIRQLIARGALQVDSGEYAPSPGDGEGAPDPARRGPGDAARGRGPRCTKPRPRRSRPWRERSPAPTLDLFERLRAWRAEAAKTQAVPPYVIFHDTVLRDIAAVRPATLGELGEIKGVGASKLERYGGQLLKLLR